MDRSNRRRRVAALIAMAMVSAPALGVAHLTADPSAAAAPGPLAPSSRDELAARGCETPGEPCVCRGDDWIVGGDLVYVFERDGEGTALAPIAVRASIRVR